MAYRCYSRHKESRKSSATGQKPPDSRQKTGVSVASKSGQGDLGPLPRALAEQANNKSNHAARALAKDARTKSGVHSGNGDGLNFAA